MEPGFTLNFNTLLAIIAGLIGVSGWLATWRKSAMAEGKFRKEVEQLAKELADEKIKIGTLQQCYTTTEADMREIKTDLKWIKELLGKIEQKLGGQ
jgi:hypothetical protein